QVGHRLARLERDARSPERLPHLIPREVPSLLEDTSHRIAGPREQRRTEADPPPARGDAGPEPRPGQVEQPVEVAGGDEVPGGAEHVGPEDRARVVGALDL